MAVVVWISSSQIAGTFQRNFVLWCRAAGLSFCCRLRLASSLLRDFVGRVGIGAAIELTIMTQIGLAKDIFSELICANGPSCQKAYGEDAESPVAASILPATESPRNVCIVRFALPGRRQLEPFVRSSNAGQFPASHLEV